MKKAYFMPFIFAAALSAMASDGTYTNFLTGVSSVSDQGVPTAVGGVWTMNNVALTQKSATAFEFETDTEPLRLAVTADPADTNTIVKLELDVTVADVGELPSNLDSDAQSAFAVCTNSYNAWNGSAWIALDEVPAGIDDTQTTNLTVELCYQGADTATNKRKVRFSIGDTVLKKRGTNDEWVELSTTANSLSGLVISGSGTLAKANASVLLGVAEYAGVKYGTLSNAVEAAIADASESKPAINVVRETEESVNITGNGISIADNGNVKGEIAVATNVTVEVKPTVNEFTPSTEGVAVGTSGTYSIPVNMTGGTVNVTLPMDNKEIVEDRVVASNGKITFAIQTATSVLGGATPNDLTAPTNNIAKLREYLAAHTNAAYIAADVSSDSIRAALEAVRTGANENGLPLYQSYALGIAPTVSVKPVTVADDSANDGITLSIPGLVNKVRSGDYIIKYKVGDAEYNTPDAIKIPLATGSHAVRISFE